MLLAESSWATMLSRKEVSGEVAEAGAPQSMGTKERCGAEVEKETVGVET